MATAYRQFDYYTPEEYLALERSADFKSEYLHGQIYAMAGSSPQHSAITANVTAIAVAQLRGKSCQAFSSDLKVATDPTGLFAYPDLSIVCGEPRFHDEHGDVLTNSTLIVEVPEVCPVSTVAIVERLYPRCAGGAARRALQPSGEPVAAFPSRGSRWQPHDCFY
jgi:hypothetical protein